MIIRVFDANDSFFMAYFNEIPDRELITEISKYIKDNMHLFVVDDSGYFQLKFTITVGYGTAYAESVGGSRYISKDVLDINIKKYVKRAVRIAVESVYIQTLESATSTFKKICNDLLNEREEE